MEIVIDTSALVAVILQEGSTPELVETTKGASLMAPSSVHWEIGNALVAACRRDRLSTRDASLALTAYQDIPIRFVEVGLPAALELALERGTYAYDAFVLSCAARYRRPLLTLDSHMKTVAGAMGLNLVEI